MAAVKEVAGASKRGPNINVVEKAQTAVNAVKVAQALNQISGLLKVRAHDLAGFCPVSCRMILRSPYAKCCYLFVGIRTTADQAYTYGQCCML